MFERKQEIKVERAERAKRASEPLPNAHVNTSVANRPTGSVGRFVTRLGGTVTQ